jgi:hypothetical protein
MPNFLYHVAPITSVIGLPGAFWDDNSVPVASVISWSGTPCSFFLKSVKSCGSELFGASNQWSQWTGTSQQMGPLLRLCNAEPDLLWECGWLNFTHSSHHLTHNQWERGFSLAELYIHIYIYTYIGASQQMGPLFRLCNAESGLWWECGWLNFTHSSHRPTHNQWERGFSLAELYIFTNICVYQRARGSVVGWDTMLQAGRSRDWIPMRLLDFSFYLIRPAAPWLWGGLSL